jgi:hypothetical protein
MAKLSAHPVGTDFGLGDGRAPDVRKGAVGAAGAAALGAAAVAGKALVDRRSARRDQQAKRAFRLTADETVPDGVRRVARGQIEAAIEFLSGNGDREAAVHETRKSLKRVRTLLGAIDRRRTQLEGKALHRADRLYATKPGDFVRAVERRWRKRMRAGADPVAA